MRMKIRIIATSTTVLVLLVGVLGVQQYISSQITSRVEREMPKASGISASIPLADLPSNIASESIKSVNINIKSFALKENGTKTSLEISASDISKAKPTTAGSLEVMMHKLWETLCKFLLDQVEWAQRS